MSIKGLQVLPGVAVAKLPRDMTIHDEAKATPNGRNRDVNRIAWEVDISTSLNIKVKRIIKHVCILNCELYGICGIHAEKKFTADQSIWGENRK